MLKIIITRDGKKRIKRRRGEVAEREEMRKKEWKWEWKRRGRGG